MRAVSRENPKLAGVIDVVDFNDEKTHQAFYRFFREIQDLFEVLSPDAFLRPYLDDYETLSRIVRLLREAYEPGVSVDRDFQRKTEALVRRRVESGAIRDTLEVYEINERLLEKIAASEQPDTVKVFDYAKAIQALVEGRAVEAPYLISIGERAEQVIRAYQERQATTHQTPARLEEIIGEINTTESKRARRSPSIGRCAARGFRARARPPSGWVPSSGSTPIGR